MSFSPKNEPRPYVQSPPAILVGGDKVYYDRELKKLKVTLDSICEAISEIQEHLKTM